MMSVFEEHEDQVTELEDNRLSTNVHDDDHDSDEDNNDGQQQDNDSDLDEDTFPPTKNAIAAKSTKNHQFNIASVSSLRSNNSNNQRNIKNNNNSSSSSSSNQQQQSQEGDGTSNKNISNKKARLAKNHK